MFAHHVHAYAAARDCIDGAARREAGVEDQIDQASFVDHVGSLSRQQPALNSSRADAFDVESATVVFDSDVDAVAAMCRAEPHRALRCLTATLSILRRLEAVVDHVANHVHEWVAQLVENASIDLCLRPAQYQPRVLASL